MKRCCTYHLIPSDWSRLLLLLSLLLVLTIVTQSSPNTRHSPLRLVVVLVLVQTNFGWDTLEHVQPNGLLLVLKVVWLEEHLRIWIGADWVYTSAARGQRSERYTGRGSSVFNLSGADELVWSRIDSTPERLCISLLILVDMTQKVLQTLYFLTCLHFLEPFTFLLWHFNPHFGQIWAKIGGVLRMHLV